MVPLSHDDILTLHRAAVAGGLAGMRKGLLAGIHPEITASLPSGATPNEQVLCDLDGLWKLGALENGTLPLAAWLANAASLSSAEHAEIFRAARRRIDPGAADSNASEEGSASSRSAGGTAERADSTRNGPPVSRHRVGGSLAMPSSGRVLLSVVAVMGVLALTHKLKQMRGELSSSAAPAGMVLVPGANPSVGSAGQPRTEPSPDEKVGAFYMDVQKVTCASFAAWLNTQRDIEMGGIECGPDQPCAVQRNEVIAVLDPDASGISGEPGRWRTRPGFEASPAVLITWVGASRYCEAVGARLPTSVQWETAARAGNRIPGLGDGVGEWTIELARDSSVSSPVLSAAGYRRAIRGGRAEHAISGPDIQRNARLADKAVGFRCARDASGGSDTR